MRAGSIFCIGLAVLLGGAATTARADVITIGASKDNTLYEDMTGSLSNGAGEHFFAGLIDSGAIRRGLVAFDVAGSIAAGSTITNVTLTLHMSRTQAGPENVGVHRALSDWGEGTSVAPGMEGAGAAATAGDATWIHTFYSTLFWTSNGGDYAAASDTTSVDGNGFYTWQSAQLIADVQSMLDTPAADFGWVVVGAEPGGGSQTAKRFDTRQESNASRRPMLTITFTPPAASGACCFSDGTCSVLSATDCANQGGTYQGDGVSCTPNPCPQPTGACCFDDGTCSEETAADCATMGGTHQGAGTSCTPNPCHVVLTPFLDALPIPGVAMPTVGTVGGAAHYDIEMTEFTQQLHTDLPATTVWGYEGTFPGPTIEAGTGFPVTVRWTNDLRDSMGVPRAQHILPVDLCPHGPNTAGDTPRTVVHLHGGHVPAFSDGYPESTFLPGGSDLYFYPNQQDAATLWYHDHALGITRLNVYMGLAGFYLVRDSVEQSLALPGGVYEIPLAIQDRTFNFDGSFDYPAAWQEHFFGDTILVNGKVWPFLNVDQGKYRFRLLNGSNSRTYTLALSDGATFHQIGTDGGLLPAPVALTELTMGPGERADLVLDFESYVAGNEIVLMNSAPAPFPGTAGVGVIPNVMKFVVTANSGDTTPLPTTLRTLEVLDENDADEFRDFELRKESEPCAGSTWLINGLGWDDITEYPVLGETEVWSFINRSGITHPMHMHLVFFQVLDRQDFVVMNDVIVPTGPRVPPPANEAGWKDTVQATPQQITRVIARFEDYVGKFAYHCHILEHEDHEMMRQFQTVLPADTKQPRGWSKPIRGAGGNK